MRYEFEADTRATFEEVYVGDLFFDGEALYMKTEPIEYQFDGKTYGINAIGVDGRNATCFPNTRRVRPVNAHIVIEKEPYC